MLELDLNLNMLGSDTTNNVSATLNPIQYNSFDDCSSSSDNEDESYEEDIIVGETAILFHAPWWRCALGFDFTWAFFLGLSNFRFEDPHGEKYITKSPHLDSPNRNNSASQRG